MSNCRCRINARIPAEQQRRHFSISKSAKDDENVDVVLLIYREGRDHVSPRKSGLRCDSATLARDVKGLRKYRGSHLCYVCQTTQCGQHRVDIESRFRAFCFLVSDKMAQIVAKTFTGVDACKD